MRKALPADMFDEVFPSALNRLRPRDKWAPLVIRCLEGGPRRFAELRVPLRRVTSKVLAPLDAMCAWAAQHWDGLLDAHESYQDSVTNGAQRSGFNAAYSAGQSGFGDSASS